MKNACLNCEKRFIGCHKDCKDYKEFKERLEIIKCNKLFDKQFRFMYNSSNKKR